MKEMYKGKVNSPATLLVETIDSSVTSIKVADGSVFPEGPNVAVIGTDGNAETIKYESINGNILVGCVRGFQGKASVWDKDTIIARNFTEYDLEAIQENILELDKKQLKDFQEDENHRLVTDSEKEKLNSSINKILFKVMAKSNKAYLVCTDNTGKSISVDLPMAKGYNSGLMSWGDKGKLDSIASGANKITKLSELENDKTFKTESEIQSMIEKASSLKKEVVTSLPQAGKDDVIYLVKDTKGKDNNNYLEYLWLNGKYELIGSTQVDLSGYATVEITNQFQRDLRAVEEHAARMLDKDKDKAKLTQNTDWQDDTTYTTPYFVGQSVGTLTSQMLQSVDDYFKEEMPKKLDRTTDKAIAPQDSNPNSSVWQDDNKYVTPKFLSAYIDLEISGRDETIQAMLGSKLNKSDIQEFTQQELEEAFK